MEKQQHPKSAQAQAQADVVASDPPTISGGVPATQRTTIKTDAVLSSISQDGVSNIRSNNAGTDASSTTIKLELSAVDNSRGTFPQGCQFSPDGTCILTARCNKLLLYNTPFRPILNENEDENEDGHEVQQQERKQESWKPVLTCPGGDTVRSYVWYPHMRSIDPSTCCFLGVSRDQPVHLYDAYTGQIRASYRPYNSLDELESPTSVCFARNGTQIIAGGFRTERMIQIFDIHRPGRDTVSILKLGKTRRSKDGQKGIISALSIPKNNMNSNILAVGTYSPGSIYIYDLRAQSSPVSEIIVTGTCIVGHGKKHAKKKKRKHVIFENSSTPATTNHHYHGDDQNNDNDIDNDNNFSFSAAKAQWYHNRSRNGITQLEISSDERYMYSASRRSNVIIQWDLRRLTSLSSVSSSTTSSRRSPLIGCASFESGNDTNQRIEFDINRNQLWVGSQDKSIRVYDLSKTCSAGSSSDSTNTNDTNLLAHIKDSNDGKLLFSDVINGISVMSPENNNNTNSTSSTSNNNLVAITLGTRKFPSQENDDEDDDEEEVVEDNGSIQVYRINFQGKSSSSSSTTLI